jgi:hypothetical protein
MLRIANTKVLYVKLNFEDIQGNTSPLLAYMSVDLGIHPYGSMATVREGMADP